MDAFFSAASLPASAAKFNDELAVSPTVYHHAENEH